MLTNEERALLHVAAVIVHGGNIDHFWVDDDGLVKGPCVKLFKIDQSSDDDDITLITMIYTAANLIELRGVYPVEAVNHLVDFGARHRRAKNVVNRVVGRSHRKMYSMVCDVVRPMYNVQPNYDPTAVLGDRDGK